MLSHIRGRRSSSNDTAITESTSSTSTSRGESMNSSSNRRGSSTEFVADTMKQMDSHMVIELLEMYATSGDSDRVMECWKGLKNSACTPASPAPESHKGKSKRSNAAKIGS